MRRALRIMGVVGDGEDVVVKRSLEIHGSR